MTPFYVHLFVISGESVRGFWSPGNRKWPSGIDLAHRLYKIKSRSTDLIICYTQNPCTTRGSWGLYSSLWHKRLLVTPLGGSPSISSARWCQ